MIEDDEHICAALRLCFQVFWPESDISFVVDGESGVNMLKAQPADIVLLDLGLPDISGLDVLRQIRAFSQVPVVMLSATIEKDYIVRSIQEGVSDYSVKPFKQIELMSRIKKQVITVKR